MTDTEKTLAADVLAERGVLTRRAPLRSRSTFTRRPAAVEMSLTREARLEARAARALAGARPRAATMAGAACTSSAPITKESPLRSEKYRRAVASLPCAHCGIEGYSQHAHENDGKGARMKVDDRRAMPLCCARPGIEGCHIAFDQYRLVSGGREAHIALGRALAAQTRKKINALGLWPAGLPAPDD